MHVPDASRVLAEMARVTKPGGRIAVYEVDFETLVIDAEDRGLARKIVNTWCDTFRNGWLGRRIPALCADLRLHDIQVAPYTLMLAPAMALPLLGQTTVDRALENAVITALEAMRWLDQLEILKSSGRFFSSLTGFLVGARRP
jgi:hypothetical protein